MKTISKLYLFVLLVCLLGIGCNSSNSSSQAAQSNQPVVTVAPHTDSLKMPKPQGVALAANGMNVIRYNNGAVKMEGNSKDGSRTGEWKSYFPDGKLQSDEFFTVGKPDGKVTVYYANGQKMYEGENDNGTLKGIWTYWNDKGKVTRTVNYSKK